EDAYAGLRILVAIHCDMVGEGFVVETILTRLDQHRVSFFLARYRQGVIDERVEVVEEGRQFVHGDRLDLHAREYKVIVRIARQVFLI
ncbi:hypothetical protein EAI_00129, partial [Harpegnathos saltator]